MADFKIISGAWAQLQAEAAPVREQVFIQEQQIAPEDEWDAQDAISQHFIVLDQGRPIAAARLLPNNSIGRVAVLKPYRGQGIGRLLMLEIMRQARLQRREFLKLSSQVHAVQFYAGLGFAVEGAQYLDCGIAHIDMRIKL
ncbi:GNAT family N-acetyltransferase [Acinetobacter sp. WCHAc010034]|uniref:GNAT family N-acetyltransferase n=1 Tax=Acinetobacter sp. WCHAc010034 TaxID=1879049 RepID=UPI00083B89F1|nr:GNAT family N-acetyltransferase [Acinetobacter sp. WCHAc010034]AYA02735.1 GNAT family N-acetyltransferase [Acinetobacter sp. WCHAc010034]